MEVSSESEKSKIRVLTLELLMKMIEGLLGGVMDESLKKELLLRLSQKEGLLVELDKAIQEGIQNMALSWKTKVLELLLEIAISIKEAEDVSTDGLPESTTAVNKNEVHEKTIQAPKKEKTKNAIDFFQHSLFKGLPNILRTSSWPRKVFKVAILLICLTGFIFQSSQFLKHFYEYPTISETCLTRPKHVPYPAFTYCEWGRFDRERFCEKFPRKCYTPANKTALCEEFPDHCKDKIDWQNIRVPRGDLEHLFDDSVSLNDRIDVAFRRPDFWPSIEDFENFNESAEVKGPLILPHSDSFAPTCYSFMSRIESDLDPLKDTIEEGKTDYFRSSIGIRINFDVTFWDERVGFLSLHSPFHFVNSLISGYRILPGNIYRVLYKVEEEQMLPYPYKTDCLNYTKIWLDKGKTGPRSQTNCRKLCSVAPYLDQFNCSPTNEEYCPAMGSRWCEKEEMDIFRPIVESGLETCISNCKPDCQKYKFTYEVRATNSPSSRDPNTAYVYLFPRLQDVVSFKHRPQYQDVEVFSQLGGLIGTWLGIALVDLADVVESLFLLGVYSYRRRRQRRNVKRKPDKTSP